MTYVLLAFCLIILVAAVVREHFLTKKVESANERIGTLREEKRNLTQARDLLEANLKESQLLAEARAEEIRKVIHQKKSSEVRTGQVAEQMAPFLTGFPYDPKKAVFLGNPIDFVVFDESGVHFVEVKSGKSQLSSAQRRIRNQIEIGSVSFEVYRVKGE